MQDRSVLFNRRENAVLMEILGGLKGQLALIYGLAAGLDRSRLAMPFVFQANSCAESGIDLVFSHQEWPLPADYFDLILLPHLVEQNQDWGSLIRQAKQALRPDGVLLITGRKGILNVLSRLEQEEFSCKTHRFDCCRSAALNRILEKNLPFLCRGFVIEARVETISLTPLQEKHLSLLMERLLNASPVAANRVTSEYES